MGQAVAAALDGADDLVDVDGFEAAIALTHLHLRRGFGGREVGVEIGKGGLLESVLEKSCGHRRVCGGHWGMVLSCSKFSYLAHAAGRIENGKAEAFLKTASRSPGLPLGGVCNFHAYLA